VSDPVSFDIAMFLCKCLVVSACADKTMCSTGCYKLQLCAQKQRYSAALMQCGMVTRKPLVHAVAVLF
jgi:hypothetical protein